MSRASWAQVGQGIGQGFSNAGNVFGQGYMKRIQSMSEQEFKQKQQQNNLEIISKMLQNPAEDIDPRRRADIPEEMQPDINPNEPQMPPVNAQPPGINELIQETKAQDPYFQQKQEIERLQKASLAASAMPGMTILATNLEKKADRIAKDVRNEQIVEQKRLDRERKSFEKDRDFETKRAEAPLEELTGLRKSIPIIESSLKASRRAIESGDLDPFGQAHLSELPGLGWLKNVGAAEFDIARKQNLIGTLSEVSARAQNMYLERMASSAFPEKGKSRESNLAAQEMIEGNLEMNKAKSEVLSQLEKQDLQQFGYVKGTTLESRADELLQPVYKEVMDKTAYRIGNLRDQSESIENLMKKTKTPVPRGTILTPKMARALVAQLGNVDRAIKRAEDLGDTIISSEKAAEYEQR